MRLILIDAKNALYRFGHAHYGLRTDDGIHTGAVYGLLGCLLRLKKKYPDGKFVMVWDSGGRGWRSKLFPEYKDGRHKALDANATAKEKREFKEASERRQAILNQENMLVEITASMGIPQLAVRNVEADDLIGILAVRALKKEWRPVIYSSDKDFMQLMHRGVKIIRTKTDVCKPSHILKEFGCAPEDLLEVRAIAGDKSDGIPNPVKGVGPKTASKWLLEGIHPRDHEAPWWPLTKINTKARDLIAAWDVVHRNYQLMRLVTRANDKRLGNRVPVVTKAVVQVTRQLQAESCSRAPYDMFVTGLRGLQLEEALAVRRALHNIMKPGTPNQG